MIRTRPFRNTDVVEIVALWNRYMTGPCVAAPLSNSEFEQFVLSRPYFEAAGMILAFDEATGAAEGFVHCGFGPRDPSVDCWSFDKTLGTIALICCGDRADVAETLIEAGKAWLRSEGSKVIYAGGRFPLNPFYWGLYGGSEFSGVLASQAFLHPVIAGQGFRKVAESTLYEFDLTRPEPRHVSNSILKRDSRFVLQEDDLAGTSWTALALESFRTISLKITDKAGAKRIASAVIWPMALYGRRDAEPRIGLIDVFVEDDYRRKGYGRLLLTEAIKCSAELGFRRLCVQTDASNAPADAMYRRLGFEAVQSAFLYRLESS